MIISYTIGPQSFLLFDNNNTTIGSKWCKQLQERDINKFGANEYDHVATIYGKIIMNRDLLLNSIIFNQSNSSTFEMDGGLDCL